ncbi:hypothetical protein IG631_24353 [Alternaria alternata]|nr:hypothetical protein IG631_24353 [Alternaria alternata]
MPSTRFGTDHERYIGSGIVALSQLPRASEDDLIIHAKELKERKRRFRPGMCKPWQKENHLKAELSHRHWKNRHIGKSQRLDGHDFPELQFREDADIRIIENMALLQVVRSSKASRWEQRISNGGRQWVVDFFRKDGSDSREWAVESSHEALSSFFGALTTELGALRSSDNLSQNHVWQSAHLVSETPGVVKAFHALSRLPSMWITKSFNFLTDVRKCFCDEVSTPVSLVLVVRTANFEQEVQNYIWAIVHQWEEITLQWNDKVVPCVNIKSIDSLQSLAPRFSENDRDLIERRLQERLIFPRLEDPALREKVKMAIRRQGPILTLSTFAKDVRLLQSMVREPMTKLLIGMYREKEDTLRKRIVDILEREFDELTSPGRLSTAIRGQKKAIVERCYQHVFLYTIRSALPKGSVTRAQLSSLVKQELSSLYADGTSGSSTGRAEGIATKAPALSHMPQSEHVAVAKRHGVLLFKDSAATQHLYSHEINKSLTPRGRLSRSFMAQHIVRIFLLGESAYEKVRVAPTSLPEPTVQPARRLVDELRFCDSSPIDLCSSDGSISVPLSPQTVYQPTPEQLRARRSCPPIHGLVTGLDRYPISQYASLVEAGAPPVTSSCSSRVSAKRPSPVSTHDGVRYPEDVFETAKRPRLGDSEDEKTREAQQMDGPSPIGSLGTAILDRETRNRAGAIISDPRNAATIELAERSTSVASPSIYSQSSSVDVTLPRRETYEEMFGQNPFRNVSQPNVEKIFSLPGGRRDSGSQLAMHSGQNPKTGAVLQPFMQRPTEISRQVSVVYKGKKPGMISQAETSAAATTNFFASQMALDPFSTFRYQCIGGTKYASDAGQLQSAIERHKLEELFVNSNRLGSDDPRVDAV